MAASAKLVPELASAAPGSSSSPNLGLPHLDAALAGAAVLDALQLLPSKLQVAPPGLSYSSAMFCFDPAMAAVPARCAIR